ncbi:hypothetical protein NDI56_15505 [Haloarcula sp. S1CR25-12]|uniref:Integral membrane protein n=1 Tax=Haloarcula saliterrae TaxID=2950534 RepID=A0ABU2FEZ9_9EURY|nr:hypothetical protein [Haloarcula sp. S1CR25-12]MDS0260812.1 hypothetical protein [Haloarcula sp. S1CR25-12]
MSALQRSRFGVSRRDVGAGLVAGVAALLANVLFHAMMVTRLVLSNPDRVFADPGIVWSTFQWDLLTVAPLVVTPLVAVVAGTVVWRWLVPDEPTPRRGAVAGVVTAFASLLVLAAVFGILAGVSAPSDALGQFVLIASLVFFFGAVGTAAIIAPLGALVGYGYEWYLARQFW